MADKLDYEKIGFKSGLEIHQQLAGKRLFSSFPAEIVEGKPDFTVLRRLVASSGEGGKIDVAAKAEQVKEKVFEYQGYHNLTGLVELDEEPVSAPGEESVKTAVMVSKMLSAKLIDEVHVMRKVVVDGSNTSGFQRTMVISSDGELSGVRIDRVCLEEDSCKIVSREEGKDCYNLSRLGIPLLEITTKPDMKSPQQLQEIAGNIGMVLRSTGRVKRGLGTIRQDVNISVASGARVELKGVQDLDLMPTIADNEARRQLALASLADELKSKSMAVKLQSKPCDLTSAFKESSIKWIKSSIARGQSVVGFKATNMGGLLGRELFKDYRVGTELKGYAAAWGFNGIIHTDEQSTKYGLGSWKSILSSIKAGKKDAVIILIGDSKRIELMVKSLLAPRVDKLNEGVISEVRKANEDASSSYLRPMPGSARMYPETDVHPFRINQIKVKVPQLLSERLPKMQKKHDVPMGVLELLARYGRLDEFESWSTKLPSSYVAEVLATKEKELKKRSKVDLDVDKISSELFTRLHEGSISKDATDDILIEFSKKGNVKWESYKPVDESFVRDQVLHAIASDPKAPFGALMGSVMARLGGKADGKLVSRILREELKK